MLEAPLTEHWLLSNHDIESLRFFGLTQIKPEKMNQKDSLQMLLQKEAYYIFKLKTLHPNGLNNSFDLSCYL